MEFESGDTWWGSCATSPPAFTSTSAASQRQQRGEQHPPCPFSKHCLAVLCCLVCSSVEKEHMRGPLWPPCHVAASSASHALLKLPLKSPFFFIWTNFLPVGFAARAIFLKEGMRIRSSHQPILLLYSTKQHIDQRWPNCFFYRKNKCCCISAFMVFTIPTCRVLCVGGR